MLYTGKGDSGTSKLFDSEPGQRVGKDAPVFEALGRLDELTSYLGLCRVHSEKSGLSLKDQSLQEIVERIQHQLFNIQAELAGADKHVRDSGVSQLEAWIAEVEEVIPPINSFTLPGGSELSAHFDISRTLVRRAERYVVAVSREQPERVSEETIAFLNRLSSVFFALARLTNHYLGVKEPAPKYN